MIEIEIKARRDPRALAELIAQTQGVMVPDPQSPIGLAASLVRTHQEDAERARPARDDVETVNFAKLDDDQDWSEV